MASTRANHYGRGMPDSDGRIHVSHTDDGARSRATVFFRLILLIPHAVWLALWGLGALLVLPVHWVGALILGRPMEWAHGFYAAFVRYALHVYAYLYLAADPYPTFFGEPGYVVEAEIPEAEPQRRWTIALRLFLTIPPFLLAAALTSGIGAGYASTETETSASVNFGLAGILAVLGWFASLALARTPQGLRDTQVYCLGYGAQVYAYLFLLTERFPTSDPRAVALEPLPQHPIRLPDADDDRQRDRLIVLFRILLVIPHFVWLAIWGIGALIVVVFGWFAVLITTRLPEGWHRFLAGYLRYGTHVSSFLYVLGAPFPGFLGRAGTYPVAPEIAPPQPQSRWKTAFRGFLAIPAMLVSSAFSAVLFVAGAGAWWCALVTGRVPDGLHGLLGWAVRYQAQLCGYILLLTDHYPYTGPDGIGRPVPVEESWQPGPETPLPRPEAP